MIKVSYVALGVSQAVRYDELRAINDYLLVNFVGSVEDDSPEPGELFIRAARVARICDGQWLAVARLRREVNPVSPSDCRAALRELRAYFDRTHQRLARCRNAVVHGIGTTESVLQSVSFFGEDLGAMVVATEAEALLLGESSKTLLMREAGAARNRVEKIEQGHFKEAFDA